MTQKAVPHSLDFTKKSPGYFGRFAVFSKRCEVSIHSDDPKLAHRIAEAISQEAWRIEEQYASNHSQSRIYRINNAKGAAVDVDTELAGLLNFADTSWLLSEGAFDISSGALQNMWHEDGDGHPPTQTQIDALLATVGWQKCQWDGAVVKIPRGMQIDLSSMLAEYTVDRAADIASQNTDVPVFIKLGNTARANRAPIGASAWQVEIKNHYSEQTDLSIELEAGSLSTHGDSNQSRFDTGNRLEKIIDPRTGWPVHGAANSITVGRGQCVEAGLLARLALLQGQAAEDFLSEQDCPHWVIRR